MKLVCCCLSQVIFYKKNLFHLITTLRCSNIDQDSQPNTHPPRKREKEEREERKGERGKGKGDPHHTTPRTTIYPLTTHTHPTHHTHTTHKGKEGKGRGKRGSLCVWSGYDVWLWVASEY